MRILIYGGSFDPPHNGHVHAARTAMAALSPDKVFFIPAALPPHKTLAAGSPPPEERLFMTALAAGELPGAEALGVELRRGGKSYTSQTLRDLKARYPADELVFLVGTDMFLSLDRWHEPEVILSLASIALFARETDREPEIAAQTAALTERFGGTIYRIPGAPLEISSTQARALLPERGGCGLVPAAVYAHIIRKRLYGAKPDFDWLRRQAYAYLKPKRAAHVRGTEEEAVGLARRWGLSEEDAAEAAICHDITKKLERDEQLRLCDKYGIITDEYERASEKLLHAKTGAVFAADLFGLSPAVTEAIRWHTTGRPGMTALEQIIYLADYIEPGREGFDGLSELRRAAYEDLDGAMELGMRMSLHEVRAKGYPAHIDTVKGREWFLAAVRRKGKAPVHADGIPDEL